MPGRIRSAAYRACPDTFSGPSSWGTGWPMAAKDVLIIVPPLRLQRQLYERAALVRQHREATLDDAIRGVVWRASRPRRRVLSPAREGRAGILCFEPVHHRLDALNVLIVDVVLLAELRRDINMGDVISGRRVDTIERLEEEPFLSQIGRDFVQAGLGVADKAIGKLAPVIAGIGVIEASRAFQ